MVILALGIDHKTAPLGVRERLAFAQSELPQALRSLKRLFVGQEIALISTCNRTEIYAKDVELHALLGWWQEARGAPLEEMKPYIYHHYEEQAVQHIMRLACGLESMVLGEPQILGQLKAAQQLAQEEGTLGKYLHRLLQSAFAVAKRVRTDTGISRHPVSIAYLAVRLAEQIFAHLSEVRVLLLGAGETCELCAAHFSRQGVQQMIIANRSLERARRLAERFSAQYISLDAVKEALPFVDVVIAATGSAIPLLTKASMEQALKKRKQKPIFLIDLAVPRNITPALKELESVYLYTIEELQQLVQQNQHLRQSCIEQAEQLIAHYCQRFLTWARTQSAIQTLRLYRKRIEGVKAQELDTALLKIAQGVDPKEVVKMLAHQLSQKFLHLPTLRLKEAGDLQNLVLLEMVHQLFIEEV